MGCFAVCTAEDQKGRTVVLLMIQIVLIVDIRCYKHGPSTTHGSWTEHQDYKPPGDSPARGQTDSGALYSPIVTAHHWQTWRRPKNGRHVTDQRRPCFIGNLTVVFQVPKEASGDNAALEKKQTEVLRGCWEETMSLVQRRDTDPRIYLDSRQLQYNIVHICNSGPSHHRVISSYI